MPAFSSLSNSIERVVYMGAAKVRHSVSAAPLADPSVGSVVVEEVSSRCLSARSAAWSIPRPIR